MSLFLITGASGSGKTYLTGEIKRVGVWEEGISHTTREIRLHDGEVDGKTYHYIGEDKFLEMLDNGEFLEHTVYDGNYYGITKAEVERILKKNEHAFIIVEHNGYEQIKKQYSDVIGIFLYMTKEECMSNMLIRGDSIEKANKRINTYDDEMKNRGDYDYVIRNVRGKQSETITVLRYIITQNSKHQEYPLFR